MYFDPHEGVMSSPPPTPRRRRPLLGLLLFLAPSGFLQQFLVNPNWPDK